MGGEHANAYLMTIEDTSQTLANNPKMGRARADIKTGDYSFSVDYHTIFSMLNGEGINIISVHHERMDVQIRLTDFSG